MPAKRRCHHTLFRISLLILLLGSLYNAPLPASASPNARGATTLHVPEDYATIQAALDTAVDGDTVLVGPGTYVESLQFSSKDVILKSEAGPANTTITGSFIPAVAMGPNGELIGFTISGGETGTKGGLDVYYTGSIIRGNVFAGETTTFYRAGVAIAGYDASPIIDGNIFTNNTCTDYRLDEGVVQFTNSSSPVIINNIFENNTCAAITVAVSSGIAPQVINNTIVGNSIGIYLGGAVFMNSQIYRNNLLYQNSIGLLTDANGTVAYPVWENNMVFDNDTDFSGIPSQTGTNGNISVDPKLNLASRPPYTLKRGSPAVNAGSSNGCPALDFRGIPRPQGVSCDIGAHEGVFAFATSIVRADPTPTNAATLHFTVTFSEAVTGVDTATPFDDFALVADGLTGAAITGVSGSGNTYTVTVASGTGMGTLRLDLVDDDSILDTAAVPLGGTGAGNANFSGETYDIDRIAPAVVSITRADPSPIRSGRVHFYVSFSEAVTGVDTADFALTATGSISGETVESISGSGNLYQVWIIAGIGIGSLRLDVPVSATITDAVGNPLANLPFLSGQVYTTDRYFLYIPLINQPKTANIYGYLNSNGVPVSGQQVDLQLYTGSEVLTIATTTLQADGFYGFNDVPSLGAGQAYWVRWINRTGSPGYLARWYTRLLSEYTAGGRVLLGNYNIANIEVLSPASSPATVNLPFTFQWTTRPATPSDSYEFDLYDSADGDPYFYTDPLGYVGSYTLSSLPAGFSLNADYWWEIWVYSPDGGYGISNNYHYYTVRFANYGTGSLVPQAAKRSSGQPAHDWMDWPPR